MRTTRSSIGHALEGGRRRALGPLRGVDPQLDQRAFVRDADQLLHERARRRDLAADRLAVLLRVVRHVVQPVARSADAHEPRSRTSAARDATRSYEIGSKWDLLNGGLLGHAVALQHREDQRPHAELGRASYTLDGDVRVRGYQLGVAGHITNKWQVFGGYTYMNGDGAEGADGTAGQTPANTPRNMLTLWTTYAFTPNWEIGGGPVYTSSRYAANNNFVKVGGYTRWDAMAAYHPKKYDVQFNVLEPDGQELLRRADSIRRRTRGAGPRPRPSSRR